jgi:proteasome activator subunit 4
MLPLFTPHHVSEAMKCQGYLVLFLPVEHQPNHTIKSQDYMSTLFSLWSMFTLSGSFDSQFSLLLSYIAEHNIQHDIFTKQQIKLMFTTTLRVLNLPLGTRNEGAGLSTTGYGQQCMRTEVKAGNSVVLRRKPEKVKSLARFIVYTITPDNNGKSFTLDLLQDLIQATELYFHPSNHGHWSYFLPDLVRHLSFQFLKRWREELEDDCKTPQHRRLTPDASTCHLSQYVW